VQIKLGSTLIIKHLLLPKNNHWLRRAVLVFAFTLFDYLSTIIFCHAPHEEANVYAQVFMENFGIISGLTMFVVLFNMPIYMTLSLDSHIVKLPSRIAGIFEVFVDAVFAWYVAGLHFSGGSSWFWYAPDLTRQIVGAILYLSMLCCLLGHIVHVMTTSQRVSV
jgi:hypothetical protein